MPAPRLQLRFDPNQDYQLDAIEGVARLLEGFIRRDTEFRLSEEFVPNLLPHEALGESWLGDNLALVQQDAGLPVSPIGYDEGLVLEGAGTETWRYPSFTIEMETGTGKTYVYLRTIHELRKRYGFGKFVIVVPSVAIYEGVVKTWEITRAHFAALYGNEPLNLVRYDGTQLSRLRSYAMSTMTEVLLITLDAFNKASGRSANNLYKVSEKLPGERKPFQYVQETRPILLLDEPQNMESEKAKQALRTLHPILALRYSATHRTAPNLVYRLTPFDAYRLGLVKRIQVVGVTEIEDFNSPFLKLKDVTRTGGFRAKVLTYVQERGVTKEKEVTLRDGDDLQVKTRRDEHKGYVVSEIDAGNKLVRFENGITLHKGEAIGPSRPEVFKAQIEETIKLHLETQDRLREKGIKVLSLFFIDRVASYTADDGIVRKLFDAAFKRLRRDHEQFQHVLPDQVRTAYFAKQRVGRGGDEVAVDLELDESDRNAAQRDLAKAAFNLIMRDKERLLSFDEPVSFIFAHSALKEGWDSPNVFQICTLNQTVSETKKRQEIGRGLRLCVNQRGERIHGEETNVLTVVANESYQSYASRLQQEYREEGQAAPPPPTNAKRNKARRNDRVFVSHPDFAALWDKLSRRMRYDISIDRDRLVKEAVRRMNAERVPEPRVVIQKGDFVVRRYTLSLEELRSQRARVRVVMESTAGDTEEHERDVKERDNLGELLRDERLNPFVVYEMRPGREPMITFENDVALYQAGEPAVYESAEGQNIRQQERRAASERHAVPNLVARAAKETGLTRRTVLEIFRGLSPDVKQKIFRNPEGFAGAFVTVLRNVLADQMARSLRFTLGESETLDFEELFPKEKSFPQKELIEAGPRGLYDKVQKDSAVEERFVERLRSDDKVVLFFKFPAAFRIQLPKLIGNYNPDWGVVRKAENGRLTLHLVRETKGSEDVTKLQWAHEQRKIRCAKGYFEAAGVDYRPITGETLDWWEPWLPQEELGPLDS
jgi:type III restriction enzyme